MKAIRKKISQFRRTTYRTLRWSEKYLKTDMVYLFKGGGWLSSYHVITAAGGFVLAIGFANLLPKDAYGTYKFVLAAASLLSAFSLTGINMAIVRAVARGYDGMLTYGFFMNLKWSFAIFGGGLIAAVYYFLNDNTTLAIALLTAGLLTPITKSGALYVSFLQGKKDFRRKTTYGALQEIIPIGALIAAIFLTNNPLIVILVALTANAANALAFYYWTLRVYQPNNRTDKETISYSKHLSVMHGINRIVGPLDKILLWHFLGAAPLAIYAFAIAPVNQLNAGKKITKALSFPKLSTRSFSEIRATLFRKAAILFLLALVLVVIYIMLAPHLYALVFPQYLDAVVYSQMYAFSLLFLPVVLFSNTLIAHQRKRELYITNITSPLIKLGLMVVLLPMYGIAGLIIALLSAWFLSALLTVFFIIKPLPNR